jgi:hypothetical protein
MIRRAGLALGSAAHSRHGARRTPGVVIFHHVMVRFDSLVDFEPAFAKILGIWPPFFGTIPRRLGRLV